MSPNYRNSGLADGLGCLVFAFAVIALVFAWNHWDQIDSRLVQLLGLR